MEMVEYRHLHELKGLEFLRASFHNTQFSKHTHEGYCIGVIEDGAQSFLRASHQFVAPKGDIIIINADEVHTGSSAVETGWCYRAIYPRPEMFQDISVDFFNENGVIPWFSKAVIHDEGLAAQLRILFDILLSKNNNLFKESLFISTMALLLQRHSQVHKEFKKLSLSESKILQIKDILYFEPEKDYQLSDLARIVGLSPWHLLRQFKHVTGLPPHAWLIQARLRKSLGLLKKGVDIASTAQFCGFSDQSHFKRSLGCTPAQYIACH